MSVLGPRPGCVHIRIMLQLTRSLQPEQQIMMGPCMLRYKEHHAALWKLKQPGNFSLGSAFARTAAQDGSEVAGRGGAPCCRGLPIVPQYTETDCLRFRAFKPENPIAPINPGNAEPLRVSALDRFCLTVWPGGKHAVNAFNSKPPD